MLAKIVAVAVAGGLAATATVPRPAGAQSPGPEEQREEVRRRGVAVASEIDVLTARDAEVRAALDAIQTQVAGQLVVVTQTSDALAAAEAAAAASAAEISRLEGEIERLDAEVDQMIVEAYVDPPIDHALDVLDADTLSEATVKDGLVDLSADQDTAAIDRLAAARSELGRENDRQEALASEARARKGKADVALAELGTARAAQDRLAAEIGARLVAKQQEAEALRRTDAALAQQVEAERTALATSLAGSRSVGTSSVGPAPGGLATASCPAGGSITVAGTIAGQLQALLQAAAGDGVVLCGSGYRDPQEQVELRRQHCGTSSYAVYEAPSSSCSPPTARPGSSMHEQGLAIDFTCDGGGSVQSGSSCFSWLSAHAADYGLLNLPSESWHWSTNGS